MTLGEAKDKVYMLLDEHSAGGEVEHDADIELKMTRFFDMAQKQLSNVKKIIRTRRFTVVSGRSEYSMPSDFRDVYRVWMNDKPATSRFRWKGGKLLVPERYAGNEILVEYVANPATIDADADDDYEFEIAGDAAECMPYFVAAQQLLPDLVMDYGGMLQMYQMAVGMLDTSQPGENTRISQTFYGG